MRKLHYLAYGSNLHPLRLMERVSSARLLGVVALHGRSVRFHKRGNTDLSGKCDLVEAQASATSFGALYELSAAEKARLDAIEGVGYGYAEARIRLALNGASCEPFVYVAEPSHIVPSLRPYHWYKAMVLSGARYHGLPEAYVTELAAVASIADPDPERTSRNEALLERMSGFPRSPDRASARHAGTGRVASERC